MKIKKKQLFKADKAEQEYSNRNIQSGQRGIFKADRIFKAIQSGRKKDIFDERFGQGTFTPFIFTSTGGMGKECLQYHSRLAQLISIRKGEDHAKTISWIRARTSFALLRPRLICLRG